jgi:hypothetical protein
VLQAVEVALSMRTPLLFENLDVLMWFPFVWAEQQEIGFSRTLGIGDNDFRRDDGFHDDLPSITALRYGPARDV